MSVIIDNESENVTDKSFVCVLDILGFKNLTSSNSIRQQIDLYKLLGALGTNAQLQSVKGVDSADAMEKLNYQVHKSKLNYVMISDSILFWTNDVSDVSFSEMLSVIKSVLGSSFGNGLPLRGALTVGSVIVLRNLFNIKNINSNDVYFGNAIIEAHELEKKMKLVGCVLSQKLIEHIEANQDLSKQFSSFVQNGNIKEYEVPLDNCYKKLFLINWATFSVKTRMEETPEIEIRKAFEKWDKYREKRGDVEFKIVNTIKYFEECYINCV
jgi:hypothetical protein